MRMHQETGLVAGFGEGFQEVLPIDVAGKYVLPAVAAAHDVVKGIGVLDAHEPWHRRSMRDTPGLARQCSSLTPSTASKNCRDATIAPRQESP
jgi:hypothetical protein